MSESLWMVRAGRDAAWIQEFLNQRIIAVGWDVGDLSRAQSVEEVSARVREKYGAAQSRKIASVIGPLSRFRLEMQRNDHVVTYDSEHRTYHIGRVVGDYRFDAANLAELPHKREVEWQSSVSRDRLSAQARNTLGSIMTLFLVQGPAAAELLSACRALGQPHAGAKLAVPEEQAAESAPSSFDQPVVLDELRRDSQGRAREFIIDRVNALDWEEMQELVAGILRAMGFKTRVSPRGPDRGCDVLASPDGLGLSPPRIFVEVKHRVAAADAAMLRSFIGGRRGGDNGMFVSTGGFTKDARYEADRANIPIALVDLESLVDLLIQHYPGLDAEARALVPLIPVYWPA